MSNRYTQLSFSNMRDLALPTLPYEQLDQLLSSTQNKVDTLQAATELTPDYIRESADDRRIASQMIQYQQGVKDQLAKIAASGNTSEYLQALSQATNQIAKMYKPGGPADILKQRKLQDEAEKKRLHEFYKDNPAWADYAIKNRQYNQVGYDPTTGSFNPINTFGNTIRYVEPKEIDEWANRNLDNIKDSLISEGVKKSKLDGITSLYDFYQLKGVPYEKIVNALTAVMPKEYIQSLYHGEKVTKFYSGDKTPIDDRLVVTAEDGKEKLNLQNPVARLIHGYATEGERRNLEHQRIKDDNEIELAKYKHDLENPYVPPTSGYTQAVTNPWLKDFDKIKVVDGKAQPQTRLKEQLPDFKYVGTATAEKYGQENKRYTKDVVSDKESSLIEYIRARFKTKYGKDMSDSQLEKAYNQTIEERKSSAITFERINDPKTLKNLNDRVLGSEKKILNIGVRPIYFIDSDGSISKPQTAQQAIDRLGTEMLDKGIEGKISADNPLGAPTGDYATAIDKNGNFVTMVIGNRSIEEDRHFAPVTMLSRAKYSLQPETIKIGNDTYVSEPVIDINEAGDYQGTDVKVTKYDAYGKAVGTWSLPQLEQEFKQTNPYK